jgi:hypothetical protein
MSPSPIRNMTLEERRMLEKNLVEKSDVPNVKAHFFDRPTHPGLNYLLKHSAVSYIFAEPASAKELLLTKRLLNPLNTDEGLMRQGMDVLFDATYHLVYQGTVPGTTNYAFFIFDDEDGKPPKQVLVQVERHDVRRFDIAIVPLMTGTVYSPEEDECDEDPQPGCPMEEVC